MSLLTQIDAQAVSKSKMVSLCSPDSNACLSFRNDTQLSASEEVVWVSSKLIWLTGLAPPSPLASTKC